MTSDDCETPEDAAGQLDGVDGILIPGGFGVRGIEGKIGAIRYARDARHPDPRPLPGPAVHGHRGRPRPGRASRAPTAPSSTRTPPTRSSPPWPTRRTWWRATATWAAPCAWACTRPGSPRARIVGGLYGGAAQVEERHRHRYEVNNAYREQLEEAGLVFSGLSPDSRLVEFIELPADVHPFFVATQAHPEFLSRPTRPHPLFSGLIAAALARSRAGEAGTPRGGQCLGGTLSGRSKRAGFPA